MARLRDLRPPEPVRRYDRVAPGNLLHIDTKKPGRLDRPGRRVNGNRRGRPHGGVGWDKLFMVINDHARMALTQMHPDEKKPQAVAFLRTAVAYNPGLGIANKRLRTDTGSAFQSMCFARYCQALVSWQHHDTSHRPHRGIGGWPLISRLPASRHKVLTLPTEVAAPFSRRRTASSPAISPKEFNALRSLIVVGSIFRQMLVQ